MKGFDSTKLSGMVEKITSGSTAALGKIKMKDYDKDDLSGMVEKITAGSTKALGEIEMEGYSSDNLSAMLEKITEGATGALSEISMDGLDESEFQNLVVKIGDGATNSLGEIRMTGYDHTKPPNELKEKIKSGTNDGYKKIKTKSTVAYITNITSGNVNGTYYLDEKIFIEVHFSDNVSVKGNPKFFLELEDDSIVEALYQKGSEKALALVFLYIVQLNHRSQDLKYYWRPDQTSQFSGGEIIDNSTNKKALLILPEPGSTGSLSFNKDLKIDGSTK